MSLSGEVQPVKTVQVAMTAKIPKTIFLIRGAEFVVSFLNECNLMVKISFDLSRLATLIAG